MKKRVLLSAAACLLVTACGFQPMYGSGPVVVHEELAQVEITNIPNREGQFLRNALIDRFYKSGRPVNPRYSLRVSDIQESSYDLDITVSSDATRAQLTLRADMILLDNESNEEVLTRKLRASASYNIMESKFATRVSEQNTRENALNDLARQIELQIALFLGRTE